ncbi:centromere protein H-like [Pelodytes ibericus]
MGEPVPQVFQRLRSASTQCLQSSLSSAPKSSQETADPFKLTGSCMQIVRLGQQIKQQLTDMKTDLQIRSLSKENIDSSLNVSLKMAHLPLQREVTSVRNKEMAIIRMQCSNALLNVLKNDSTQNCSLRAVMTHSMDTCTKIQAIQLSNRQLEEKLVNIRQRRMEMRLKQQELFRQVKTSEEKNQKRHDLEMKTPVLAREKIESISNKVVIIQELFLRFILSAQVNWAEDPHLTCLLMKMKDSPLSCQDK